MSSDPAPAGAPTSSHPLPALADAVCDPCSQAHLLPPAAAGPSFDLSDPYYAIEHLARLFRLEVDSVRELTYRDDFPLPIKIGRRWLWFPDEIDAWTRAQKRYRTDERRRNLSKSPPPEAAERPLKPYQARSDRAGGGA